MLREAADLGFEYVELSHGIRITLVPGVLRAIEEGVIKACSAHNFCPLPPGITQAAPNLFEPSAREKREQSQWLRQTRRSLDFAAQVGAKVLVLHLGSVQFFWSNPARKLRRFASAHPAPAVPEDPAYQRLLARAREKLRKRMGPYWEQTQKSLAEILPYATEKGITLGFENREKFSELPVDADFAELLGGLPPSAPAGYWHDTGHAQLKQGLGLLNHREHLEKNAARLIGFHLHDVDAQGHDHQTIGTGQVDFAMVREFWRPEHRLVLELSPRLTLEQVRASKARVEELIG